MAILGNTPDGLIARFGRRVLSGKLRKPPSSGALAELQQQQQQHNGARLPSPPIWASVVVIATAILSFIGTIQLGRHLVSEKNQNNTEAVVPYITAAIPFFILQILVENFCIWAANIGEHSPAAKYDLADTWASMHSGWMQMIFIKIILGRFAAGGAFIFVYNFAKDLPIPRPAIDSWLQLVVLFIGIDFCYYWLHRCAHTNALMWLGHSVHHDAEHYNLSTALRQGMLQAVASPLFSLPLALLFPPRLFLTYTQFNTLYQFWVHTCCVRRLGPLEYIMMTPSHHRVHHDRRVHKNFGGMFIIWDRLFGSFLDELAVYSSISPSSSSSSSSSSSTNTTLTKKKSSNNLKVMFSLGESKSSHQHQPSTTSTDAVAVNQTDDHDDDHHDEQGATTTTTTTTDVCQPHVCQGSPSRQLTTTSSSSSSSSQPMEKCFFGQKRASTSWTSAITQIEEPLTFLSKLSSASKPWSKIKATYKGPGYYTAGMRRRNALPERSSLTRFRILSKPTHTNDLSALHILLHSVVTSVLLFQLVSAQNKTTLEMIGLAIFPVMSMMCSGIMFDGGRRAVTVECLRCILVAIVLTGQLYKRKRNSDTKTIIDFASFILHAGSAITMLMIPSRYVRVRTRC